LLRRRTKRRTRECEGREEGEGDHLSARGAMVLPAEPSKGQNRGGVVALTRFLGVEIAFRECCDCDYYLMK
jgi:hypothetical protein